MSGQIIDLDEERLKKSLAVIYSIQERNCMPDDVMPQAMEKLGLDEDSAISLLSSFIRLGWISTGNIKEKFFLRPGYVHSFPVVVSARGLEKIKG
ncbi:MAG: hypothetical protein K6T65_00515 [Peptococcaceae bacterium]|nr:hypothetical protein [Peptococcaceae bacterium]